MITCYGKCELCLFKKMQLEKDPEWVCPMNHVDIEEAVENGEDIRI